MRPAGWYWIRTVYTGDTLFLAQYNDLAPQWMRWTLGQDNWCPEDEVIAVQRIVPPDPYGRYCEKCGGRIDETDAHCTADICS